MGRLSTATTRGALGFSAITSIILAVSVRVASCDPLDENGQNAMVARLKHGHPVQSVIFGEGDNLITGCEDGTIRVWNLKTGKETKRLPVFDSKVFKEVLFLARSPGGKTVIFCSGHTLQAWEMSLEKPLWQSKFGSSSTFSHLTLSHNGDQFAVATIDHDVWVMESATGKLKGVIKSPDAFEPVSSVNFAPKDKAIVVAFGRKIVVWDASSTQIANAFVPRNTRVDLAALSPNGKLLLIGYQDTRAVDLWDVEKQMIVGQLVGQKGFPSTALFLDDDNLLTSDTAGTIIRWNLPQRKAVRKYQCDKLEVIEMAISPDRKRVAAACEGGDAVIIDLEKQ
jgi:WD40 repeat protein